jgi:hypothetical protein
LRFPLVEPIGEDQATALTERPAENRLDRDSLGAGVEELRADRRVLRSERHQPPSHRTMLPTRGLPVQDDCRCVLARRDGVPGRRLRPI